MKNIDHIGIAVKDIEKSNLLFEKLLNTPCYKIEEVKDQGVKTSFFKTEDHFDSTIHSFYGDGLIIKFFRFRFR